MYRLINKIDHYIGWEGISNIGKIKILKSSYYIFIITPIFLKIIESLKQSSNTLIRELSSNIDLPFDWKLLFFSALSISLGNILYFLYCPDIISDYKHFDDFKKTGYSNLYFKDILSKFYLRRNPNNNSDELDINTLLPNDGKIVNYFSSFCFSKNISTNPLPKNLIESIQTERIYSVEDDSYIMNNKFLLLRRILSHDYVISRREFFFKK